MGPEMVSEVLAVVVTALGSPKRVIFTRAEAMDLIAEVVEGEAHRSLFWHALLRLPGIEKIDRGEYALPAHAASVAKHRDLRLLLGKADLADMEQLWMLLDSRKERELTPRLRNLKDRIAAAMDAVGIPATDLKEAPIVRVVRETFRGGAEGTGE
jgi:hypothetical protein